MEKKKYFRVRCESGGWPVEICSQSRATELVRDLDLNDGMRAGTVITFEVIELTDAEFEALPEI